MLVSSGILVILTASVDPWTWMVMATTGVAIAWLALAHLGAGAQRAWNWLRGRPQDLGGWDRDVESEDQGSDNANDGSDLPRRPR